MADVEKTPRMTEQVSDAPALGLPAYQSLKKGFRQGRLDTRRLWQELVTLEKKGAITGSERQLLFWGALTWKQQELLFDQCAYFDPGHRIWAANDTGVKRNADVRLSQIMDCGSTEGEADKQEASREESSGGIESKDVEVRSEGRDRGWASASIFHDILFGSDIANGFEVLSVGAQLIFHGVKAVLDL